MFKRREKRPLKDRALEYFWPSIGWRRFFSYLVHRLGRMPGSAYSIAGGFACGAAISFTPFVGLHFVISAILAWIIRANIIASAIGTAVGNPWTFPFIWTWLYQTGLVLTRGKEARVVPEFSHLFGDILEATISFDIPYLVETAAPVFWPMLVSSVPTGFVVWWIFYLPLKYAMERYQERRLRNHARRAGENRQETIR